jgi:hypothetical protein
MRYRGTYLVTLVHVGIYLAVALAVFTIDVYRWIKRRRIEAARAREVERMVREHAKRFEAEIDKLFEENE